MHENYHNILCTNTRLHTRNHQHYTEAYHCMVSTRFIINCLVFSRAHARQARPAHSDPCPLPRARSHTSRDHHVFQFGISRARMFFWGTCPSTVPIDYVHRPCPVDYVRVYVVRVERTHAALVQSPGRATLPMCHPPAAPSDAPPAAPSDAPPAAPSDAPPAAPS